MKTNTANKDTDDKKWWGKLKPPIPFLSVYPPLWLFCFLLFLGVDIYSKVWITKNLNYNLSFSQYKWVPKTDIVDLKALGVHPKANGQKQINILGDDGKFLKLRLVFNDRFIFGLGPNLPYLGFFLSFFASCFLVFFHWYNMGLGNAFAWLLVFSGAFGNLTDKMFIKSLSTREWRFSLVPMEGYVSGVVDFLECIWFGLSQYQDTPLLNFLSMSTWPTFNIADSMILVGLCILIFTMPKVSKV